MDSGQHGLSWFMTLYPSMCDCIESDYRTRRTVAILEAGHCMDRLTECRERQEIWNWTRLRIAMIAYQRHGYVGGIIVNIQFAHSKKNIWNEVKIFLANSTFCEIDIIIYSKAWLFKENKNGFKEKTYFNYFYLQLNIVRNINFNALFI